MYPYPIPYILRPEDQLYFLHIPKTAGTTLISLLDLHFAPDEICPIQLDTKIHELIPEKIAHYRLIRGHLDYDFYKLLAKKPIYITMLRDPLERVISLYEYWRQNVEILGADQPHNSTIFRDAVSGSLYDFVCFKSDLIRFEVENNQVRRIVSNNHDSLDGFSNEEILEVAKNRLAKEFLWFGLLEKFDESLELLNYSLAWWPIRGYDRKMVTPTRLKSKDIPSKTREAILERNQLDYALYDYASELFSERYRDMIYNLLDVNYQKFFKAWNPEFNTIVLTFDQVIQGDGWYGNEKTINGLPFRWSGPRNESFLDVRLPRNSDLEINIFLVGSILPELINELKLFVNETEICLKSSTHYEYLMVFQGFIPKNLLTLNPELTRLKFWVSKTVSPQQLYNTSDTRRLSLAYHKISFKPLN